MSTMMFGYMSSSLRRIRKELKDASHQASFIELQIHDKIKYNGEVTEALKFVNQFHGYFTIHGEGETDGKKRIQFSSLDKDIRQNYIKECINLYSSISKYFDRHKILRLILHPDTLSRNISRNQQLKFLAQSLVKLSEIPEIDFICIEPRGGDRQGKVLRADIEDIRIIDEQLSLNGPKHIGLCIDIAQLFIAHGNSGILKFLDELRSINLPIKEFHISDVRQNEKVKNRVAMEVGTGNVNWRLILPSVLYHCNNLLIETLGGIKVFQRSKAFLESILKENNMT